MSRIIDLTNKKFCKLTVLYRDFTKNYDRPHWMCQCECGNKIIVSGANLKKKNTKSCGCLQKEMQHINGIKNKKYNQYDLSGEYGIGYTFKGEEFYFDLEDYDKIKNYCWCINNNGYVVSRKNKKEIQLHRLIMNCPVGMVVDHINGKITRNNNKKSNLRICTNQENIMNRDVGRNNTSTITGVGYSKSDKKWYARININNKRIHLGYFDNFEDAKNARINAELKYFKEYSYYNR